MCRCGESINALTMKVAAHAGRAGGDTRKCAVCGCVAIAIIITKASFDWIVDEDQLPPLIAHRARVANLDEDGARIGRSRRSSRDDGTCCGGTAMSGRCVGLVVE